MKLILDLDDTILDTKRFKKDFLFKVFEAHNISSDVISSNYSEYTEVDSFNLKHFLNYAITKNSLEEKHIDTDLMVLNLKKDVLKCVKPEYLELIKKAGRENVIIVTKGDKEFQEYKIESCGLFSVVDERYIISDSKDDTIKDHCTKWWPEEVIFVDDSYKNILKEDVPDNLRQVYVGGLDNLSESEKEKLKELKVSCGINTLSVELVRNSDMQNSFHKKGRMI